MHSLAATLDKVAFSELQHELLVKPYTINNFNTYFNTESKQKRRINVLIFIDMVGNLDKSHAESSI